MGMLISNLMKTNVIVAQLDERVDSALDTMQRAGIRHLPVVDAARLLVGIVSERDLARAAAMMETAEGRRESLQLKDILKKPVLHVPPTMPAHEAAAMMIEHKISVVPVVDARGIVCGVVTATDFLEVAREALLGVAPASRARA